MNSEVSEGVAIKNCMHTLLDGIFCLVVRTNFDIVIIISA